MRSKVKDGFTSKSYFSLFKVQSSILVWLRRAQKSKMASHPNHIFLYLRCNRPYRTLHDSGNRIYLWSSQWSLMASYLNRIFLYLQFILPYHTLRDSENSGKNDHSKLHSCLNAYKGFTSKSYFYLPGCVITPFSGKLWELHVLVWLRRAQKSKMASHLDRIFLFLFKINRPCRTLQDSGDYLWNWSLMASRLNRIFLYLRFIRPYRTLRDSEIASTYGSLTYPSSRVLQWLFNAHAN